MRIVATVGLLALAACTPKPPNAKERAEACVRKQVPGGGKVSASEAHVIVGKCQGAVSELLDLTMHRGVCQGSCDYSDLRIRDERRQRKEIIERELMSGISDEVEPVIIL